MNSLSDWIAPAPDIKVDIRPGSIEVRLDASTSSPHRRFYAGAFYLIFILAVNLAVIFGHDKYDGPSLAEQFPRHPLSSPGLLLAVMFFVGWNAVIFLFTRRALVGFYPSDETFHCDASTLTISKVRWLDTSNTQWETRSFPISEISQMRFATIASDRYRSVRGLRFLINGTKLRSLPGLHPAQANKILAALQELGVDLKETSRFKRKSAKPSKAGDRDSESRRDTIA